MKQITSKNFGLIFIVNLLMITSLGACANFTPPQTVARPTEACPPGASYIPDQGCTAPLEPTPTTAPAPGPTSETEEPLPVMDGAGVILPAGTSTRENNSWRPTLEQVQRLEEGLIPFLKNADDPWLRPDPPIWERLPDYKRQYLGLVEDGRRVIYGNYFCEILGQQDWQATLVEVADGGDCYFQIKYDPDTEKIYALSVNGES